MHLGYSRRNDGKKALQVLEIFEEEGLYPRPSTLRYLANLLKKLEMEIPFTVPERQESSVIFIFYLINTHGWYKILSVVQSM